jgi:hypothetical protein
METMTEEPGERGSAADDDYNYERFDAKYFAEDAKLAMKARGAAPGDIAPDFELRDTEGRVFRLGDLGGKPVVLITGSGTCPLTRGSLPGLKEVYEDFADRTHWFYLYVREAHPGERLPSHQSYEQKADHAERFRAENQVPWPVLVDDLDGSVAHRYSTLPNAAFVIDSGGNVAFRGAFAHGPTLYRALDHLLAQDGKGVIPKADDRMQHMLGPMAFGWDALERGGERATNDLWSGARLVAANLYLGHQMKPLIAPLAGRGRPIPTGVKVAAGAGLLGVLLLGRRRRRR